MKLKNKRGGEKYLSLWWFFILAVIGVGLVEGVSVFNARTIDTRELEADILAVRLVNCFVDLGTIKQEILSEDFDIYSSCFVDKTTIENSGKYLISYEIYPVEGCVIGNEKKGCNEEFARVKFIQGVKSFKEECKISQRISAIEYPKCSEKYVFVFDSEGKNLVLHVLTGTNNNGGRIVRI